MLHQNDYSGARTEICRLLQLGVKFKHDILTLQLDGMDQCKTDLPHELKKIKLMTVFLNFLVK